MSDDMFDLGDPADDATDDTASDASNDDTGNNDSTAGDAATDPERTPAYDTDYRTNQHTVAALDETWQDVTDLLEDARAYSKLAGYSGVSRLEAYEAMFRLLLEEHDAEEVAESIQAARHEAHDD
ncbi:hypothetical protein [Haladaptatus sp. NG-SE-30]